VISLDFELFWGVKDHVRLEDYRENLLGVRKAIPAMLALFQQYGIHATWAAVGMLFFDDREHLIEALPTIRPAYKQRFLSSYELLQDVGKDEASDPYHFAASLIRLILDTPGQEIGTHTFSHYYCLEDGQDVTAFRADLQAAKHAAQRFGVALRSIVFPRNQFNREYLSACADAGLAAYRGNPPFWWCQPLPTEREKRAWFRRGVRLADNYVSLSGRQGGMEAGAGDAITDVPASRFLRPWSRQFRKLENLRFRRIQGELDLAAYQGTTYHLWWHPHNFGVNLSENIGFLERILQHFAALRKRTGMQSCSMAEAAMKVAARPQVGHVRS